MDEIAVLVHGQHLGVMPGHLLRELRTEVHLATLGILGEVHGGLF